MTLIEPKSIDVSILIVNYKTPHLIIDCLRSVYARTTDVSLEVIVADNDSGDGSQAIVMAEFPAVHWIDMGYNAGFSRANNRAMTAATGRHFLLLNSDTLLVDDLIGRCVHLLDTQSDVAAVSAMQINREGKVHYNVFDTFGKLRRYFYIVPQRPVFQKLLYRLIPDTVYSDPNEADWLVGAFLMVPRRVVAIAGPLDEDFFLYGEDVEWCYRLGRQGRMLLLRDAFYVHLEYGSSTSYQQQAVTHINRFKTQMQVSNLLWIRKQYGVGAYLVLIAHYITIVPVIFAWKVVVNLRNGDTLLSKLENQRAFAQQVGVFLRFFRKTLFNQPHFYKI
ncbi:MAG: glycosyltransferase family 2 protein [Bacteroidetes bacterium]|nr:glycosyltransferase family 2 protein [Fibrella sp.]